MVLCHCSKGCCQLKRSCPVCKRQGNIVNDETVRAIAHQDLKSLVQQERYFVCGDPGCEVVFYNSQKDQIFLLEDVEWTGEWMMNINHKQVTAVVLAGGGSTRMGRNKALLKLGNKTMIERVVEPLQKIFDEVIVITNTPEIYSMLQNVRFVPDSIIKNEKNSLIGIYTGLLAAKTPYIFVIACDMPFVNTSLVSYMIEQVHNEDIVFPVARGYYEPLYAIYKKTCLKPIKKLLDEHQYRITNVIHDVSVRTISEDEILRFDPDLKCFLNINTYEEYQKIKEDY